MNAALAAVLVVVLASILSFGRWLAVAAVSRYARPNCRRCGGSGEVGGIGWPYPAERCECFDEARWEADKSREVKR